MRDMAFQYNRYNRMHYPKAEGNRAKMVWLWYNSINHNNQKNEVAKNNRRLDVKISERP